MATIGVCFLEDEAKYQMRDLNERKQNKSFVFNVAISPSTPIHPFYPPQHSIELGLNSVLSRLLSASNELS